MKAKLVVDSRDLIGEGPYWDSVQQRILWMDNGQGRIHEGKSDGAGGYRETRKWDLNRRTGAAIARKKGGLIVAGGVEIIFLSDSGEVTPFARLNVSADDFHINDAKCDPQGRLWLGTIANDFSPERGSLYRLDTDGKITAMLDRISLSNGIDWSPDGKTLYYIDTGAALVSAFDFDGARGTISNRRTVVKMTEGKPDGMTVDSEGYLWVASPPTHQVRRYSPEGKLVDHVEISSPLVLSCAFGGADCGDLFITSGAIRMPDVVLPLIGYTAEQAEKATQAPGAGGLFVARPGVKGRFPTPFAG